MRLKCKVEDLKGTLLVFFILYATDSALVNTNMNRIWARISWVLILWLFVWLLVKKTRWKLDGLVPVVLLCGCFLSTMVFKAGENYVNYIQRIILLLTCFMLPEYLPYRNFMKYFIRLMRLIAVVSILGYLCRDWIMEFMSYLPTIYYSDAFYVKSLLFTNVSVTIPRNYGPFWEPGAYQLYLNWAIFYEIRCFIEKSSLTLKEQQSEDGFYIWDIILFSTAVLTTSSTAGILILVLEFTYFMLQMRWTDVIRRRLPEYKIFILAAGIVGIIMVLSTGIYEVAFAKLQAFFREPDTLNSATVSAYTRFHGIGANISIMQSNPLFGVGIRGLEERFLESFSLTANTNSILAMGATFGIFAMVLYIILILRCVRNGASSRGMKLVFLTILLAMYSTEPLLISFFFTLVLFYEGRRDRNKGMG